MEISDKLTEFYQEEQKIEYDANNKIRKIKSDKYNKLCKLNRERRVFILSNMPFKYGDRLFYHCDKGSGYYGIFKGIRNWKVVMEITTKTGRRKFKDFEIDIKSIRALKKI